MNCANFLSRWVLVAVFGMSMLCGQVRTIHADITGDGVNDDIKIGEDFVFVVDKMLCCIKKRHIIVRDLPNLVDIIIDEYCRALPGKEIGVVMRADTGLFTEIYGMKNNEVHKVADSLPGIVEKSDCGGLYGFKTHLYRGRTVAFPYSIREQNGVLCVAGMVPVIDTMLTVAPGTARDLSPTIPGQAFVVVSVTSYTADINITYLEGKEQLRGNALVRQGERFSTASLYHHEGTLEVTLEATERATEVYCTVAYCEFDNDPFR